MDDEQRPSRDGDGHEDTTVRRTFDWSETKPSAAVVEVVSNALGVAPTDVEPLYTAVDPEALDSLLSDRDGDRDCTAVVVTFTFADRHVTVEGTGTVVAEPVNVG
ncbi:HalOD1 output domain-containing protein [Halorubellus sp. PRR65]|uniref:HalOD1 output domain-containing protein n=1 Tax=Halorubellus sp. PRR65 TaxID=3098148 RepID=UPI002B26215E|nr:HalOD1 output domain-containing protein [Halorubellus sp. PRR65]